MTIIYIISILGTIAKSILGFAFIYGLVTAYKAKDLQKLIFYGFLFVAVT